VQVTLQDGNTRTLSQLSLPVELSSELFCRSGRIRQVAVEFPAAALLGH
jgi:hypothetical protein